MIPKMTSNTSPSGVVSGSSQENTEVAPWKAFDGSSNTIWRTDRGINKAVIQYAFTKAQNIKKYTIVAGGEDGTSAPMNWTFEGSNDGTNWTVLDTQINQTNWIGGVWGTTTKREYSFTNNNFYSYYRLNITQNTGNYYYLYIHEIEMLAPEYEKKHLIYNNNKYIKYDGNDFVDVVITGSEPTDQEYIDNGMDDLSIIPESAWNQLQGDVDFCFFTDDPYLDYFKLQLDSLPYSLEGEWGTNSISVIEYTDSVITEGSVITTGIEPMSVYEELGDKVDVLYYTEENVPKPDIEIVANYSPLDEVESDFEVVTWTNEIPSNSGVIRFVEVNALPFQQFLINQEDIKFLGDIRLFVAQRVGNGATTGKTRYMFSFDGGDSWLGYIADKWRQIDVNDKDSITSLGMTADQVNRVKTNVWERTINDETRVAYYIDERANLDEDSQTEFMKYTAMASANDVKFSDLAFYLLNTTATINLTFAGNKLKGILDDADKGKVKYRVLLNGNPYYPATGHFTELLASPYDINIVVDDRMINFGVNNTLKVEFQDYWGLIDSWTSTFIGTHSGLVFTDESGNFYTTAFGEVLKNLDFGQIIAGQTTVDYKVLLMNNIGYDVKNVSLTAIQPMRNGIPLNGVTVELSKEQTPFIPLPELFYPDVLTTGDSVGFAVRIVTTITADEEPSGRFDIRVNADRVI